MQQEKVTTGPREAHLRDYWKIVWQGRWTVGAVFLLVLTAVAARTFLQTPTYRAIAVVEVQPQARRLAPGQDVSGLGAAGYGWFAEEKYQNTQIEIIRSRAVAERAFQVLVLADDPRFQNVADPVGNFLGQIKVEPRRETGLIEISIDGADRFEVARWVNAVQDTYVERNLERARDNAKNAVNQMQNLLKPLKSQLAKAEEERFGLLSKSEAYNPENQQEIVKQRLMKLYEHLNATRQNLGNLRSLLQRIQRGQEAGADPMTQPELAQDPVLQDLNRQKIDLEKQLESVKVTFRPGAAAYQEKETQLAKVRQRIVDEVAKKITKLNNDYAQFEDDEKATTEDINGAQQDSMSVGLATSQYNVNKTDAVTQKQLYDVMTKTMGEIQVGADLLANNVSVLDKAIPPLYPVKPSKRLNLVLGAIMGMFLGIGAVFFLDYLDNTFRSPEDIERFLQLSTIAVIPKHTEEERPSHAVKEAFQSLRTGLVFLSKSRERKVVLVTSTAPQEGKSSTVANLARTLASAGDRVVVVDCDLRRPTQHLHLKLERENGLTNYISAPRGMEDWSSYIKTVGPINLQAITCGPIPPNPAELIGSERFARLLADLRNSYDWILLDSPPSISLSDAVILASLADMVLLVIRHNDTDRDLVIRSVQQFQNVGASIAGVVLNNVDIDRAYKKDYYYAGYYYYGADDTSEKGKGEKKKTASVGVGSGTSS